LTTDDLSAYPARLYDARQVAAATFLGTPIAGSILIALNYRAMGSASAAWKTVGLGGVGTAALAWLAYALPKGLPGVLPLVLQTSGMYYAAGVLQGRAVAAHRQQNGRQGSWWAAYGVGLACFAVAVIALYVAGAF